VASSYGSGVLIIKRINNDQWRQLVRNSPGSGDVPIVKALCEQRIPVRTFTESGLVDAENLALSDACIVVGTQNSIEPLVGVPGSFRAGTATVQQPTPSVASGSSIAQAMSCAGNPLGIETLEANLAADGAPFAVSYRECNAAVGDNDAFVVITRPGSSSPENCAIGIPVTNHLYFMRMEQTALHTESIHIKATHREDDSIDSLIEVKNGHFVFSSAKASQDVGLHCE
jgi:hypothetical protein